ncbi:MAG: glutamyl-tRNA reductase [Burkholderiaceae bacterium]|nr:glutamyl-tRNA reductase [Burkholderiaceae bacterium]
MNHTTAPLAVRERVAFIPEEVCTTIGRLRERLAEPAGGRVTEAAIVSTCNRTELYCAAAEPEQAHRALAEFVATEKQLNLDELQRHTYVLPQTSAVRHAFRVASGLDSMVLGEPQILGQMKQAEKLARSAGGLGLMLNHLFQRTFAVAKEVRTTTEIGTQSVSMAAAAVRVAQRIFGNLGGEHILFVGAGEMIELTATHFAAQHPKSITVANRTIERAEALAHRFHASAIKLADLSEAIARYDIVVSCTASSLPIIGLGMIERAIKSRRRKPMFIVDLAIESRVRDFDEWVKARRAVPLIQDLRTRADALRRREMERALKQLARGESPEAVIEHLSQALTNKFLHDPMSTLREVADDAEQARLQAMLARFYSQSDD